MNAPAAIPEPAARVPSTAARLRLSASEARNPDAVIAPRAKNQNPSSGLWNHGVADFKACAATRMLRIPYASQNAPHMPCIAVAIASRALYAHIPARNWARPPNIAANGASASPDVGVPHQPAMFDATMKVAPAKPKRPRIDGAAIGCRKTRVATPSLAMSSSVCLRLSLIVLVISDPFRRFFSYISYCEVFKLAPPGKEGGREPR